METLVSCSYDSSGASQALSSFLGNYRSAVNRVVNEGVMDAIDALIVSGGEHNTANTYTSRPPISRN